MERNRWAQEQLLWDLELLCGAGLGLFWPPRVQFCGLRNQAQCDWSQCCRPGSRIVGGSEWPKNRGAAVHSPPAQDLPEAGREAAPKWQAEPKPGFQELNSTTTSSFGEPGGSEFKREEKGQAHPETQKPSPLPSRSLQGRKLARGTPGPSDLSSQDLPGPQDGPQVLGWRLHQERAELQKMLGIAIPQSQREENLLETEGGTPQGQRMEAPQGEIKTISQSLTEKTHHGLHQENKNAPQGQTGNRPESPQQEAVLEQTREAPHDEEGELLQPARGAISRTWEEAQGVAPTQPGRESDALRIPGDSCRPLEQLPQPGGRDSPSPRGRTTQRRQGQSPESAAEESEQGPVLDGAQAPLPPPTGLLPPDPGPLSTMSSGQQERPASLSRSPAPAREAEQEVGEGRGRREGGSAWLRSALGEARAAAETPKATKAAWPEPSGREKPRTGVSAAQQESALQRLLELHGAARSKRRQAREQQRLRVLERLHIARNRHCRVHPLEPPSNPVQRLPQEDTAAGQRRALREQLQHTHQERTRQLRALGARNTQNFQQLLWPETLEGPAPGE